MESGRIFQEHLRRNRTTRHRRDTFSHHRARIMKLLARACPEPSASLCILGAGNCNDIELEELAGNYQRVTLVDLDDHALSEALEYLPPAARARVRHYGGTDLSGILSTLSAWLPEKPPPDAAIDAAIRDASVAPLPEIGRFDVVASTCLLSQLIDSVIMALGSRHPRFLELTLAVRNRHLRQIVELLNLRGAGVLVTDVVSTDTAPQITRMDESVLHQALVDLIAECNFFTGGNPFAIQAQYQTDSQVAHLVERVEVTIPWRWDIGPKQFLVCAVLFRRRP
jgi:hypothetical protein